jgi:hypothetical protein
MTNCDLILVRCYATGSSRVRFRNRKADCLAQRLSRWFCRDLPWHLVAISKLTSTCGLGGRRGGHRLGFIYDCRYRRDSSGDRSEPSSSRGRGRAGILGVGPQGYRYYVHAGYLCKPSQLGIEWVDPVTFPGHRNFGRGIDCRDHRVVISDFAVRGLYKSSRTSSNQAIERTPKAFGVAHLGLVRPLHEYEIEHEVQSYWHPDH